VSPFQKFVKVAEKGKLLTALCQIKKYTFERLNLMELVCYKRNNVELLPLLKNDVFQKNYFK
jgi:hypothetical protein